MRLATLMIIGTAIGAALPNVSAAQMTVSRPAELKKYNVTIRCFDPAHPQNGQEFVLPVDSPDEEHAIASTIANAASFSKKADGLNALPVAFIAVRIAMR